MGECYTISIRKKIVEFLDAVVFLLELFIYLGADHPKAIPEQIWFKVCFNFLRMFLFHLSDPPGCSPSAAPREGLHVHWSSSTLKASTPQSLSPLNLFACQPPNSDFLPLLLPTTYKSTNNSKGNPVLTIRFHSHTYILVWDLVHLGPGCLDNSEFCICFSVWPPQPYESDKSSSPFL